MSREAMQKALDALERYEYAEARVILRAALSEPVQPIGPLAGCVAVWCEEASEDVADWGSYTPEYFQQKHGLQEDIDKWKKRAEQCYNAAPPTLTDEEIMRIWDELLSRGRSLGSVEFARAIERRVKGGA